MGVFTDEVNIWVNAQSANLEDVVRLTVLKMLREILLLSPVGNPATWKSNQRLRHVKAFVARHNRTLRSNPANLTKNGKLKKGLGLKASATVTFKTKAGKAVQFEQRRFMAPKGYSGGRFRGNWQLTFDVPAQGETGRVDKTGAETLARGTSKMGEFDLLSFDSVYFTNNVPYAVRLEYGWSQQAPQGMVRVTAQRFNALFNEARRELGI